MNRKICIIRTISDEENLWRDNPEPIQFHSVRFYSIETNMNKENLILQSPKKFQCQSPDIKINLNY